MKVIMDGFVGYSEVVKIQSDSLKEEPSIISFTIYIQNDDEVDFYGSRCQNQIQIPDLNLSAEGYIDHHNITRKTFKFVGSIKKEEKKNEKNSRLLKSLPNEVGK